MATDLFISYAREDRAFVERLEEALRDREREVWIDHEIRPSEPWRDRLAKAIEGANACVFVLSPDFVRSDECRRELLHAGQHSKRLIPIVWRDVGPATVDETLRQLNWIFFRDDDFDEAVDKLVEALDTDFGWLETHTRLTERAVEWQQGGKERSYLLSGRDLREMETWLAASADHRPAPTSLHMEYLLASRAAATRRQRLQLAAVTAGLVVAVALALVALYQRQQKERQRQRAVARQLAAQARAGFDDSGTGLLHAALLSAESLRHHPTPDAAEILSRALELLPRALPSSLKIAPSSSIALSGDGAWIAVGTWGDDVELVNLIDGTRKLMPLDKQRHELTEVALGEHGELLATAAGSSVRVWRWQTREEVVSFTPARAPRVLAVAEEAGAPGGRVRPEGAGAAPPRPGSRRGPGIRRRRDRLPPRRSRADHGRLGGGQRLGPGVGDQVEPRGAARAELSHRRRPRSRPVRGRRRRRPAGDRERRRDGSGLGRRARAGAGADRARHPGRGRGAERRWPPLRRRVQARLPGGLGPGARGRALRAAERMRGRRSRLHRGAER